MSRRRIGRRRVFVEVLAVLARKAMGADGRRAVRVVLLGEADPLALFGLLFLTFPVEFLVGADFSFPRQFAHAPVASIAAGANVGKDV